MIKAVSVPKRLSDGSKVYDVYVYTKDEKFIIEADCEVTADRIVALFEASRILEIYTD